MEHYKIQNPFFELENFIDPGSSDYFQEREDWFFGKGKYKKEREEIFQARVDLEAREVEEMVEGPARAVIKLSEFIEWEFLRKIKKCKDFIKEIILNCLPQQLDHILLMLRNLLSNLIKDYKKQTWEKEYNLVIPLLEELSNDLQFPTESIKEVINNSTLEDLNTSLAETSKDGRIEKTEKEISKIISDEGLNYKLVKKYLVDSDFITTHLKALRNLIVELEQHNPALLNKGTYMQLIDILKGSKVSKKILWRGSIIELNYVVQHLWQAGFIKFRAHPFAWEAEVFQRTVEGQISDLKRSSIKTKGYNKFTLLKNTPLDNILKYFLTFTKKR